MKTHARIDDVVSHLVKCMSSPTSEVGSFIVFSIVLINCKKPGWTINKYLDDDSVGQRTVFERIVQVPIHLASTVSANRLSPVHDIVLELQAAPYIFTSVAKESRR